METFENIQNEGRLLYKYTRGSTLYGLNTLNQIWMRVDCSLQVKKRFLAYLQGMKGKFLIIVTTLLGMKLASSVNYF